MAQSPSWEANWFCSWSRNSPHFIEPESSLPYSQVPATCPYPEPTPSSPHHPLPLSAGPSYCYPPIYVWVSPVVSFPQASPPKPCAHLSPPPYAPHFSILQPVIRRRHYVLTGCVESTAYVATVKRLKGLNVNLTTRPACVAVMNVCG